MTRPNTNPHLDAPRVIRPGRRVTAVVYGERKTGTVEDMNATGTIAWVIWDGQRRMSWQHATSLTILYGDVA